MTTHTPGPWHDDIDGLVHVGSRKLHIAQVATVGMGHAAKYNAALIAAAPELLQCLKSLLVAVEYGMASPVFIEKCHAAIARATGK